MSDPESLEDRWLARAKRLEALASTGRHFTRDAFDDERYAEIAAIAASMLADLGRVPVERIEGLVSGHAQGYATPRIDVRGAVFEGEAVLLVKEASDGRWCLPGGYADVGSSAAENVEREVAEEAGLAVRARRLVALRHKARHGYAADARDFYKLVFLCERTDDAVPRAAFETTAVDWFARAALPPLSRGRTIEADVDAALACLRDPDRLPEFD